VRESLKVQTSCPLVVWLSKREQLGVDGKPVGAMLTEFQVALKDYLYKDCNTFVKEVDAAALDILLSSGGPKGGKVRGPVLKKFLFRLHNELEFRLSPAQAKKVSKTLKPHPAEGVPKGSTEPEPEPETPA
jgi:hypothetical protein